MQIYDLFVELDYLVMHRFGDLSAALNTERGRWILSELLSGENRVHLRNWYDSCRSLNPGAEELRDQLERRTGERLGRPPLGRECSEGGA